MNIKKEGPPGDAITEAAPKSNSQPNPTGVASGEQSIKAIAAQLSLYAECVFVPDDIVEIRLFATDREKSGRSKWLRAAELPKLAAQLLRHSATQGVYVGVNPRSCIGNGSKADTCSGGKCGRCRHCTQLARCVFVDIDNATLDAALVRLRESGLPAPTLIVVSGGGVHLYWRLSEPLADLDQWSEIQRRLIAILNSDRSVNDAPRVMRLPGFQNHKYNPSRACTIIEAHPDRVYSIVEFELPTAPVTMPTARALATDGPILQGARNQILMSIAGSMRARGCSEVGILAALQAENLARCNPPLPDSEVRAIAKSAGHYAAGSTAPVKAWNPFPVDLLPAIVGNFVIEGARAMGCDPAYIALPVLAVLAAAIGTTRRIQLKGVWCEPSIVWAVIVGYSGTLKSPAYDYAIMALKQLQALRFREYMSAIQAYKLDMILYESQLAAWKRAKQNERGEQPREPIEPIAVRYMVADTTVEALAPILLGNPRGILLSRDELAGWLASFDRYRVSAKGGDSAQWLEMHRSGFLLVDRKTGVPRTIFVPLAGVSIAGTIQPEILQRSLGREHFENGLAARLLIVYPPRGRKRWTDADVPNRVIESIASILETLLTLKHNTNKSGDLEPIDLPLDDDAYREWTEFYDQHADRQAETHDGDLAAAFSKLEGYAARFALIFHFVKWAAVPDFDGERIGVDSMRAGVALARWFCDETERVYAEFAQADGGDDQLVRFIRSRGGSVSVRDLMRGPREFRGSADELRKRLHALVADGKGRWIRAAPGEKGGRPSDVFQLCGDSGDGDKTTACDAESTVSSPSPVSPQENAPKNES